MQNLYLLTEWSKHVERSTDESEKLSETQPNWVRSSLSLPIDLNRIYIISAPKSMLLQVKVSACISTEEVFSK